MLLVTSVFQEVGGKPLTCSFCLIADFAGFDEVIFIFCTIFLLFICDKDRILYNFITLLYLSGESRNGMNVGRRSFGLFWFVFIPETFFSAITIEFSGSSQVRVTFKMRIHLSSNYFNDFDIFYFFFGHSC